MGKEQSKPYKKNLNICDTYQINGVDTITTPGKEQLYYGIQSIFESVLVKGLVCVCVFELERCCKFNF